MNPLSSSSPVKPLVPYAPMISSRLAHGSCVLAAFVREILERKKERVAKR